MVKHYNTSIVEDGNRIFNLKGDFLSSEVSPIIQPTIPVVRPCHIVRHSTQTASGAATVFTTPTDRDFFLTYLNIGMTKDVTCDIASGAISASGTTDGVSRVILGLPVLTLTAERAQGTINFNPAIKIDRNTGLTLGGTFTAGSCVRTITIGGFIVETK